MSVKQLIFGSLLLLLATSISAEYDVNAVCTLVPNGVRIGSIESCQKYYVCSNGKALAYSCPSGTKFSKNEQICLNAANVECYLDNTSPCSGKSEVFVPKSGSCSDWTYCKNGQEISTGTCPNNLIFQDGKCQYGYCSTSTTNVDQDFKTVCQVMPNNIYFGSTLNCNKWQICKNEKLNGGFCKDNLVYNADSASCTYETESTCAYVTGTKVLPDVETYGSCTEDGATKSTSTCSDYLRCVNGQWSVYSCAEHYFFDVSKKTCVARKAAITAKCDRCQFSKDQFVNAVDEKCRSYLICANGVKQGSNSCATGYFFEESSQACVKISGNNNATYISDNGACNVAS
ncbi:peritrophin-48-like [Anastrepha ludens]|uniref:peritrophin-48-like n=1 Tax=Anastrepha ludens TaxID=28586 RepID=UPI0023AF5618|nr:peritrophin-48-like [Anastrepha ludens]